MVGLHGCRDSGTLRTRPTQTRQDLFERTQQAGMSELISTFLPAGRYVVEIRSFYTRGETGELVFNSGAYRLIVRVP